MSQLDLFNSMADIIKPVTDRYHNTTHLTGKQLTKEQVKTGTQNGKILQWFRENSGEHTPSLVWRLLDLPGVPLTSIRRGITDLTIDGYLEKTGNMKIGIYGKPEGCWRIKR